jgi:hypothetical protein
VLVLEGEGVIEGLGVVVADGFDVGEGVTLGVIESVVGEGLAKVGVMSGVGVSDEMGDAVI